MAIKEADHILIKLVEVQLNQFLRRRISVDIASTITMKVNVRLLHAGVINAGS